jgi:hypothetical protein
VAGRRLRAVRRPGQPELPYVVCWCGGAFALDPSASFHTFADHLKSEGGAVAHVLALTLGVRLP